MSNYIFDNAAQQASQRFTSLETLYDPWTIRNLEATGIGPGWQCWEVGGGGGSIAAWLAERCGLNGHVLVTDIDLRFLMESAALDQPMIETRRHDIAADPLPAQTFDLIHARLVLFHVPEREQALQRMVGALKPGGWIVIEDFDRNFMDFAYPTPDVEAAALYQKMQAALGQLMEVRGVDPTWGRSLYRRLRAHGLVNLGMEGYVAVREGRSPGAHLARANFEQIREEATSAGLITTKRLRRCSHCLMTLISPSAPTYCSAHGVAGPNLSLPLVHAYFLPFSLALKEPVVMFIGHPGIVNIHRVWRSIYEVAMFANQFLVRVGSRPLIAMYLCWHDDTIEHLWMCPRVRQRVVVEQGGKKLNHVVIRKWIAGIGRATNG